MNALEYMLSHMILLSVSEPICSTALQKQANNSSGFKTLALISPSIRPVEFTNWPLKHLHDPSFGGYVAFAVNLSIDS